MGSIFRYVHDDALFPCDGPECHFCESDVVPVYDYYGLIVHPEHAANPELAQSEPEISELCADCILTGHIEKQIETRIIKTIDQFATDKLTSLEAFHRTPDIPLFQRYPDWPMCCGEWCEFVGVPASYDESIDVPAVWQYWEHEPRAWQSPHPLKPESLREVSLFKCLGCENQYFTWQFT